VFGLRKLTLEAFSFERRVNDDCFSSNGDRLSVCGTAAFVPVGGDRANLSRSFG
jgi:hypothetical protein